MKVRVGAATDVGRARERNEDSFLTAPPLFAVADGMGGHRGGNVASSIAVGVLADIAQHGRWPEMPDQFRAANRAILDRSRADRNLAGMGTTLTAGFMEGALIHFAHVGDTRAYLLRDGQFTPLTEDHTLVHEMEKQGRITKEEAETHPQRSILIRALGVEEPLQVDESSLEAREGDRLLLCSDGLHSMVSDQAIENVLENIPDPQEAANRLIDMANQAGGLDNITVMILDFQSGDGVEGTIVPPPDIQEIDRGGTAEMPVITPGLPERTDITVARPIPTIPPDGGPQSTGGAAPPASPGVATATQPAQAPPVAPPAAAPTAPAAPAGSLEPRGRRRRWLVVTGIVLLTLVALVIGARLWLDTRWYVGVHEVEGEERVAVFRGIPTVIFGIRLDGLVADEFGQTTITLDELARAPEARLWIVKLREGVIVDSQEEAEGTVGQIQTDLESGADQGGTAPPG